MSQEKATASRGSHYVVTEKYLLTRGAALQLPAKQFQSFIHDKNTIYGMVIDMPMNPALLCSLVVADGKCQQNSGRSQENQAVRLASWPNPPYLFDYPKRNL